MLGLLTSKLADASATLLKALKISKKQMVIWAKASILLLTRQFYQLQIIKIMKQINEITLADIPTLPIGKLSTLPPAQLLSLQEQAEKNLKKAKILKDWLDSSVALKYREISSDIRQLDFKDSGTVHFTDGDYKITSILSKKVEWDQKKLKDVVTAIRVHGEDPEEYVETSYKILEGKYSSWPEHIKNIFRPARIFKLAKENFVIEPSKEVDHE